MAIQVLVLGPPAVSADAGPVPLSKPRLRTMFTALALNTNSPMPAERLAAAIWDEPPGSAAEEVRTAVALLRRALRSAGVSTDARLIHRNGYLLVSEPDELDLDPFTVLFRQGHAALDADDHYAAANLLGRALATWRGPAGAGCEAFGWLRSRLSDVDGLRTAAAEDQLMARLLLARQHQW